MVATMTSDNESRKLTASPFNVTQSHQQLDSESIIKQVRAHTPAMLPPLPRGAQGGPKSSQRKAIKDYGFIPQTIERKNQIDVIFSHGKQVLDTGKMSSLKNQVIFSPFEVIKSDKKRVQERAQSSAMQKTRIMNTNKQVEGGNPIMILDEDSRDSFTSQLLRDVFFNDDLSNQS